jgi:hypothetical protein
MDRQYNGEKKKNKRINNDIQNITQKTKDRATRTKLKTGDEVDMHSLENRQEKLTNDSLFYMFLKLVEINHIFSDNVHIYLYIISQS